MKSTKTQKKSKSQTYRVFNALPEFTVERWLEMYHSYVKEFYSTPIEQRQGSWWEGFMKDANTLKTFLKKHKVKFI